MSISRINESTAVKSIQDVKQDNERRISADAPSTEAGSPVDLGLRGLIDDCAELIAKHNSTKIISMSAIDVSNMINSIRPHGVYRSEDIVLVTTPYGIVLSSPTVEHTIGSNDTLLNFVFSMVTGSMEKAVRLQFTDALECLHYEFTDMMRQQPQFQPQQ